MVSVCIQESASMKAVSVPLKSCQCFHFIFHFVFHSLFQSSLRFSNYLGTLHIIWYDSQYLAKSYNIWLVSVGSVRVSCLVSAWGQWLWKYPDWSVPGVSDCKSTLIGQCLGSVTVRVPWSVSAWGQRLWGCGTLIGQCLGSVTVRVPWPSNHTWHAFSIKLKF